jgi:hypothetical protein
MKFIFSTKPKIKSTVTTTYYLLAKHDAELNPPLPFCNCENPVRKREISIKVKEWNTYL